MKFCIATLSSKQYDAVCAVSNPNKAEYAARWGYDFEFKRGEHPYSTVFFDRHRYFLRLLSSGRWDWILCIGGDAIITNMTIPLSDHVMDGCGWIMARDALQINSDVFLARCCPESAAVFVKLLAEEELWMKSPTKDQDALESFVNNGFEKIIKIVPQRTLQSYEYSLYHNLGGNYAKGLDADGNDGQWQRGDFCLHVPAHMERKAQILKDHLPLVVR